MWEEDYGKGVGLGYRLTSPPLSLDVYSHFLQSSVDSSAQRISSSFCLFSTHDAHAIPDDASRIDIYPRYDWPHTPVIIRIFSFVHETHLIDARLSYILLRHQQIFFFYQINFWKFLHTIHEKTTSCA